MLQFIVLGLIPGTHLQITLGWLLAFVVSIVALGIYIRKHHQIQTFLKTPVTLRHKKVASKPSA